MKQAKAAIAGCAFLLVACGPIAHLKRPESFAQYRGAEPHLKIISADGVRMQARRVTNEPKSDAGLWLEGVRQHLKHEGYRIIEEGDVQTKDGQNGRRVLSVYRLGEQDFAYLIAVFVRGDHIFLVEAAGPFSKFSAHKAAIEESLRSFEMR